jgi:GTP diphosphokinase / guanosine-3',5'-bis(diphosphate) 3'-diphosphatase
MIKLPNDPIIHKAYEFSETSLAGQKRLSGDTTFSHSLAVAEILMEWKLDSIGIAAGLLHDVVEDSDVSIEQIRKQFGDQVGDLVWGVTKIGELKYRGSDEEFFAENLRKMLVVMAKDLRVVLIKLADRLHNMETLSFLPPEKQYRIAKETLEIYAPMAERLGIGELKGKLEDLSFPYIYPDEYQWVVRLASSNFVEAEKYIDKAKKKLITELKNEKIEGEVHGRKKHLYSLWRKLLRPEIDKDIEKIYDLTALRILVNNPHDCYAALGIVHKLWKPVPAVGIRDFIAQPKPNGYRSIHTSVFGPEGKIIEVQIRTYEMHDQAENGIASHWYYGLQKNKQGMAYATIQKGFSTPDEKLSWVKQLVSWQKEITGSHEYLEALRFDALKHRIFIFSPKGDVYDLPVDATPIDFAYAVHTDLGNKMIGAKINGKLVPFGEKLKSGQIVEIMIDKNKTKPSRDWLNFAITQIARKEIQKHSH